MVSLLQCKPTSEQFTRSSPFKQGQQQYRSIPSLSRWQSETRSATTDPPATIILVPQTDEDEDEDEPLDSDKEDFATHVEDARYSYSAPRRDRNYSMSTVADSVIDLESQGSPVSSFNKHDDDGQQVSPSSSVTRLWHRSQAAIDKAVPVPISWWPLPVKPQAGNMQEKPRELLNHIASSRQYSMDDDDQSQKLYIHLCFNNTSLRGFRQITVLRSIQVPPEATDRQVYEDLFREFRKIYYSFGGYWGWRRRLSLKALAQINYVKFELTDGDYVMASGNQPSIPPKDHPDYVWMPNTPYKPELPMESDTLVRYFYSPHEASSTRLQVLGRLPKRRGDLVGKGGRELGWGLEFVDGVSIVGFGTVTLLGVIGAITVAIVTKHIKGDTGSAVGFAGLVLSLTGLFLSFSGFVISRRATNDRRIRF